MKLWKTTFQLLLTCALLCVSTAHAQDKPNIVLVFMDNFGWGEPGFNGGGIIRGRRPRGWIRLRQRACG